MCPSQLFHGCKPSSRSYAYLFRGNFLSFSSLFLYRCIYEFQLFTLDWLNYQIANYSYDIEDKSHKPEEISKHNIIVDMYVKQKAVAMNTLVFILPHILGPIFEGHDDVSLQAFYNIGSNNSAVFFSLLYKRHCN